MSPATHYADMTREREREREGAAGRNERREGCYCWHTPAVLEAGECVEVGIKENKYYSYTELL